MVSAKVNQRVSGDHSTPLDDSGYKMESPIENLYDFKYFRILDSRHDPAGLVSFTSYTPRGVAF